MLGVLTFARDAVLLLPLLMFDASVQSYPDFCRAMFDTASQPVREAVVEMERRFGKVRAAHRPAPVMQWVRTLTPAATTHSRSTPPHGCLGGPCAARPCLSSWLLPGCAVLLCSPQLGQTRWLYLMLWMAKHGNGLVPPKNMMLSAKRLRVT